MGHAVLIIEDEATLAKNTTTFLRRHGYSVERVTSGEEGLAQLDTFQPDLVLLDYHLPRMNGLEVLAELQQRRVAVKTIMITGQGNPDVAARAREGGAYYRTKPFSLLELKDLVEQALRSRS